MHPENIVEQIRERFPDEVQSSGSAFGQTWTVLKRDHLDDICRFLKDDPDVRMDYLIDVTAVDWLPRTPRFEVVYHVHSMKHGHRLRLKVPLEEDDPVVPSVSAIWRTACWHERETYDMFGIIFQGNSDLRRILMPDDWEGHPLRKDYPLEGPEWKFKPW
ncbi:MAG: NADH-quinone oxidoreductase subunit C [Nitrospirota bacterium]